MNKEYEQLILQFAKEGYKISEEQAKEIYKQQKKDQESILDLISKILLSYTILDSVLKLGDIDKIKLKNNFNNKISSIVKNEDKQEKDIMQNILEDVTKEKYYSSAYAMNIGTNFKLQKIVNKKIDNEIWSDRLWSNKKELGKTLNVEIDRFLQGKTNVNKIEKVIKNRFNQNAFNTHRLVQTEVARCQSAANDLFAENHGIKEQMFCATLDNRTSEKCRGYDGKIFDIDDNNKPIPPLHPFCRSCLINVPYKGWEPTKRKDNDSKDVIDYQDYNKWLKEKGINNNGKMLNQHDKDARIEEIRDFIKSGKQPLTIEKGKQGKHILGDNNYIEGRSYLTIDKKEVQELINKYAGTGTFEFDRNGKWKKHEIINTNREIGVVVDPITGEKAPTKSFKIHYSKKGTHIVPRKEE